MKDALFYGCGTALVTPFDDSGIDYKALGRLLDWQVESGADAIVLLGTTGEAATLTPDERTAAIEYAAARIDGRVPLIIGTGSNDTRAAVRLSKAASRIGADALLVVTPYYNKASEAGIKAHYLAIADSVDIPIIMYNVPGRTGVNLQPGLVAELARHPNLCAIKEASGSLDQLIGLAEACGDSIAVYSGCDDQVIPAMALGARGVISVAANVIPVRMRRMTRLWLDGEYRRALAAQLECLPLIRALFSEVNPIPVKAALGEMGMIRNQLRLPLTPIDGEKLEKLRLELRRFGLI